MKRLATRSRRPPASPPTTPGMSSLLTGTTIDFGAAIADNSGASRATLCARPLPTAAAIANRFGVPLIIMQTNCPQEVSLKRISKRSKEKYESNAITEEAYLNNKKKFENVDLDDLRKSFPNLRLMHLIVDTQSDEPENWFITGVETR